MKNCVMVLYKALKFGSHLKMIIDSNTINKRKVV